MPNGHLEVATAAVMEEIEVATGETTTTVGVEAAVTESTRDDDLQA